MVGLFISVLVMLVIALVIMRMTAPNQQVVSVRRARNKAGGVDWDYTPDRAKH